MIARRVQNIVSISDRIRSSVTSYRAGVTHPAIYIQINICNYCRSSAVYFISLVCNQKHIALIACQRYISVCLPVLKIVNHFLIGRKFCFSCLLFYKRVRHISRNFFIHLFQQKLRLLRSVCLRLLYSCRFHFYLIRLRRWLSIYSAAI